MARITSLQAKASTKRLKIEFLNSASTLWSICTKHTSRVAKKLRHQPSLFLTAINTRATCFGNNKRVKTVNDEFDIDDVGDAEYGLWQRSIIMGDKCQPLDFSGVICYDSNGKKLDEAPVKLPRASPLPAGHLFSSAVASRDKEFYGE